MNDEITLEKSIAHLFAGQIWNELPQYEGYVPINGKPWEEVQKEFEKNGFSLENPQVLSLEQDLKCMRVMVYGFEEVKGPMIFLKKVVFCKVVMTNKCVAITCK